MNINRSGFHPSAQTLGDDVVAAATIDRLVHHAHVIGLDGDSYRTRAHRDTINQQTK